MNKTISLILLLDFFILLFISVLVATGLYFLSIPFISGFLFSFSFLFLTGILLNSIYKIKINNSNKIIELETAKLLASQKLSVNCAYCRANNETFIRVDKDIEFNCISCKQPNKVILQYGAVRVTSPLNV